MKRFSIALTWLGVRTTSSSSLSQGNAASSLAMLSAGWLPSMSSRRSVVLLFMGSASGNLVLSVHDLPGRIIGRLGVLNSPPARINLFFVYRFGTGYSPWNFRLICLATSRQIANRCGPGTAWHDARVPRSSMRNFSYEGASHCRFGPPSACKATFSSYQMSSLLLKSNRYP